MQKLNSLFVAETNSALITSNNSFLADEVFWMTDKATDEVLYQQIVFKVLRKPKQLILHVQRIFFTYNHKLADQLYAALVDLIWVLDGRGKDLAKKLILATRSLLTDQQLDVLSNASKQGKESLELGNKFSLFSTGYIGRSDLLMKEDEIAIEHDILKIAHDYIEYSQFDAAREMLEKGVFDAPERVELQHALINLYKATRDNQAFTEMHNILIDKGFKVIDEWQEVLDFFSGQINEK